MNPSSNCNDAQLRQLLERGESATAAAHVESCQRCQSRLAELAAAEDEWQEARRLLDSRGADAAFAAEARERPWSDALGSTSEHEARPAWTEAMARQLLSPPSHP